MSKNEKPKLNSALLDSLKTDTPFKPEEFEKVEAQKEEKEETIVSENKGGKKVKNKKTKKTVTQNTNKEGNYIFEAAGVDFESFDKTTKKLSYMSAKNHEKLSMLSNETGSNIMDMADSIISDFFNNNNDLIKKIMQKKISNIWE